MPGYTSYRAEITAANTARNGTGTIVDVVTGAANGTKVEKVTIKAEGVTTAGMVRFFLTDGADIDLLEEIDVTAVASPGATTQTFEYEWLPDKLLLGSGQKLSASTHNAEAFDLIASVIEY